MLQPTGAPEPWPEVNRNSYEGMFPTCVIPGLYLIEWRRHIVAASYFVAAYTVQSSGYRLQVTWQVGLSKISVLGQ